MAHATFFNTDEAWHYSVANQESLSAAYRASLTLAHPPLMVVVLYFWRHLGTSDLMIRLPGVVAGALFCWFFYKWLGVLFGRAVAWCGLILAAFLPPMIVLSAEVRQYSWMLMFALVSAYFLERALGENSLRSMWTSSLFLWLAMLSHYSAFLFAASLGLYTIVRMIGQRPSGALMALWGAGQLAGVGLAALLYRTHISKLGAVYPVAQPLQRFGDFYIADWYFHPGRDHLVSFLYRGTFGVFRFAFGQTAVGQIAALLFVAGVVVLAVSPGRMKPAPRAALLLVIPFVVSWIAVAGGLFPYGRTRQCVFLAVFGIAGVSVAVSRLVGGRSVFAAAFAIVVVALCALFGKPQGRDMLPLAEQRHQHMDEAVAFLRTSVSPTDTILTDRATRFQLRHYLCGQEPVNLEAPSAGFDSFQCGGLRVISTGPNDGALTAQNVADKAEQTSRAYGLGSGHVWIVQGGWASGLGEALSSSVPAYSQLQVHSFGRYLEVFQLPQSTATAP